MVDLHPAADLRSRPASVRQAEHNTESFEEVLAQTEALARITAPSAADTVRHEQYAADKAEAHGRIQGPIDGASSFCLQELLLLLLLTGIAILVRLFRVKQPSSVVFDEAHFGKFASKYMSRSYFVDVHPPFAKLLITASAFLAGYDGNFDFSGVGTPYKNVPFVAMRLVSGTLGVLLVPVTYLILRALGCSGTSRFLGAMLVTLENGLITQSRLILLDAPLLFFTALSLLLWIWFHNENSRSPFTLQGWSYLFLTGLNLGAAASCKWVGVFTMATVGTFTVTDLWTLLRDKRVPITLWIRHFSARAICLILLPLLFYVSVFYLHFRILSNTGDGDGFMSAEFQHTLRGRETQDMFAGVGIGSKVTIRNLRNGGFLHSHNYAYPEGSQQQQVTLTARQSANDSWRIISSPSDRRMEFDWPVDDFYPVRDGTVIRLEHTATGQKLRSLDVRPPVSQLDSQNEVSCYGLAGSEGDATDDWIVEIQYGDKIHTSSIERLQAIRSKFRLRHSLIGCYLSSRQIKLPEWAFEQQEVTCDKNVAIAHSLWTIGPNSHPKLPADAEKVNYIRPNFFSKFLELQRVMWEKNASLTKRHPYGSRPLSWPLLQRGMSFWGKQGRQIYLLGNPVIWWLGSGSVAVYILARTVLFVLPLKVGQGTRFTAPAHHDQACDFLVTGWALHYLPFFLMSRELFLHHYLPALYLSILLFCVLFDVATSRLDGHNRLRTCAVLILLASWAFFQLAPLAYGTGWTRMECERAKWLRTWDFTCEIYT